MIKVTVPQEGGMVKTCVPKKSSKHRKQNLTALKGGVYNLTMILRDFNVGRQLGRRQSKI